MMNEYPHTCQCGAPCYEGMTKIKCSSPTCRHYEGPTDIKDLGLVPGNWGEVRIPGAPVPNHESRMVRLNHSREALGPAGDRLQVDFPDCRRVFVTDELTALGEFTELFPDDLPTCEYCQSVPMDFACFDEGRMPHYARDVDGLVRCEDCATIPSRQLAVGGRKAMRETNLQVSDAIRAGLLSPDDGRQLQKALDFCLRYGMGVDRMREHARAVLKDGGWVSLSTIKPHQWPRDLGKGDHHSHKRQDVARNLHLYDSLGPLEVAAVMNMSLSEAKAICEVKEEDRHLTARRLDAQRGVEARRETGDARDAAAKLLGVIQRHVGRRAVAKEGKVIVSAFELLPRSFRERVAPKLCNQAMGLCPEPEVPDDDALSTGPRVMVARDAYYNDTPTMSDAQYDELAGEVREVREWLAGAVQDLGPAAVCAVARLARQELGL